MHGNGLSCLYIAIFISSQKSHISLITVWTDEKQERQKELWISLAIKICMLKKVLLSKNIFYSKNDACSEIRLKNLKDFIVEMHLL